MCDDGKRWQTVRDTSPLTDTDELGAFVQYPEEGTDATDHLRPSALLKNTPHKQAHINNKLLSGGSYEKLYILLTHSNLQSLKRPTDNIWCLSLCKKKKQQLVIFLPFSPGQLTTQMQKKGMEARDADRKKGRMEAWSERENKHCLMTVTD